MMNIDLPVINSPTTAGRLEELYRYTYKLAEQLKYELQFEPGTTLDANAITSNPKLTEAINKVAKSNIKDYVIEQGVDGNWKYRKWRSGIVECWGKFTKNDLAISTAVGSSGWYRSEIQQDRFPSNLLKEATYVDISPIYWNTTTNTNERLVSLSKDHTQWIVMSKTSMTSVNFDYVINAKGTWK